MIAMTDGAGVCGINLDGAYPNLLLEPTSTTFWLTFGSFAFAALVVVPCAFFALSRATREDKHPGHDALKKTLVFEAIAFTFCLVFYGLSLIRVIPHY